MSFFGKIEGAFTHFAGDLGLNLLTPELRERIENERKITQYAGAILTLIGAIGVGSSVANAVFALIKTNNTISFITSIFIGVMSYDISRVGTNLLSMSKNIQHYLVTRPTNEDFSPLFKSTLILDPIYKVMN